MTSVARKNNSTTRADLIGRPEAVEEEKMENGAADPTIDQVRELLFGQTQRSNDQRHREIDATIAELRKEMLERFAAVEARMDQMALDTERRHATTVDAIGSAIADLGAHVRKLAEPPARK